MGLRFWIGNIVSVVQPQKPQNTQICFTTIMLIINKLYIKTYCKDKIYFELKKRLGNFFSLLINMKEDNLIRKKAL